MIDHELHPSGNDRVNWPHLDHAESSERLALDTGGTTAWTTFDLHGNLAATTAAGSATIVSALRYDAYDASLDTYTAGSGSTEVPWRYQGLAESSVESPGASSALESANGSWVRGR